MLLSTQMTLSPSTSLHTPWMILLHVLCEKIRDLEIAEERYSTSFCTKLLPGMYSLPISAVPKPHLTNLRLSIAVCSM